jgi:TPR repeat protein
MSAAASTSDAGDEARVRLLRDAADGGDAVAQVELGCCLEEGTGVTKDEIEAVRYYRMAADQGDVLAFKLAPRCQFFCGFHHRRSG